MNKPKVSETKTKKNTAPAKTTSSGVAWRKEYNKYFVAPASTPQDFRVLDVTDSGNFTLSSHT